MSRIDARFSTAARRSDQLWSLSPKSTDRRLVSTDQFRLPSPTNKAVNPIRRSSSGVQGHINRNDRGVICQNRMPASTTFFRVEKHACSLFYRKSLSDNLVRALRRLTRASAHLLLVENTISWKQRENKFFSKSDRWRNQSGGRRAHG